jgi:hypothetical protein
MEASWSLDSKYQISFFIVPKHKLPPRTLVLLRRSSPAKYRLRGSFFAFLHFFLHTQGHCGLCRHHNAHHGLLDIEQTFLFITSVCHLLQFSKASSSVTDRACRFCMTSLITLTRQRYPSARENPSTRIPCNIALSSYFLDHGFSFYTTINHRLPPRRQGTSHRIWQQPR